MSSVVDKKRRNFLKILALGGGALVVGKLFGGNLVDLFAPTKTEDFKNFKVTEKGSKFTISTKEGEELFIMDDSE